MLDQRTRIALECLILAQHFETLWAYHAQSSGGLFEEEAKGAARQFLSAFDDLVARDDRYADGTAFGIGPKTNIRAIVEDLRSWSTSEDRAFEGRRYARFTLWALLTGVKSLVLAELYVERHPQFVMTTEEFDHASHVVRWRAHLPARVLDRDPAALLKRSSDQRSIVVVADIRRSQDLMTYALDPEDFAKRMLEFLETSREIIAETGGMFDKFTGDGFLAYFTPSISEACGTDHIDDFLLFVKNMHAFAQEHFATWRDSVRKLPDSTIGLAIGADVGHVRFVDDRSHLVAVGDAIVWATRMASEAGAGETLLNNLLFQDCRRRPGVAFQARTGATKNGETFMAQRLTFVPDDVTAAKPT